MDQQNKRKKKAHTHFNITLSDEQKEVKEVILKSEVSVLTGDAGTGKSLLGAQIVLDLLYSGTLSRVIISRPMVEAGEKLGTLPGDIDEKLSPYTSAIYDNLNRLKSPEEIQKFIDDGKIIVLPVGVMRGFNLMDSVMIVEEAQNLTFKQVEMILTRICEGAKIILIGDSDQCDLKDTRDSGFPFIKTIAGIEGYAVLTLTENHRSKIVKLILEKFKAEKEKRAIQNGTK